MTTPAAVSAAIACEVDAIGFVFAPSVRRLSPLRATELAAPARHKVACVAVTRHPSREDVADILREFRPDILQTDIEDIDALDLPRELPVLPVLRPGPKPACAIPRRVPVGGSAAELALRLELILAGGLTPANVADAIRHVRPFGVDVSSGVEDQPGIKNTEMIERFVAAARLAALEMEA
jgi:phosphoribosylanthranilate isomerase